MSDFFAFGEGNAYISDWGLPPVCWFALSVKAVSSFTAEDTLAGGIGEISGTGYARQSQPSPNWPPLGGRDA